MCLTSLQSGKNNSNVGAKMLIVSEVDQSYINDETVAGVILPLPSIGSGALLAESCTHHQY